MPKPLHTLGLALTAVTLLTAASPKKRGSDAWQVNCVTPDSCLEAMKDADAARVDVSVSTSIETDMQIKQSLNTLELVPIHVRIPKAPYGTTGSGTCHVRFNLRPDGSAADVRVSRCPDAYADHISESATEWRYQPILDRDGNPRLVRGASFFLPWQSYQITVPQD